jgi:hypothetical protein
MNTLIHVDKIHIADREGTDIRSDLNYDHFFPKSGARASAETR